MDLKGNHRIKGMPMKHATIFFLLALTALISVSCNKSSSKSKSSSSSSAYCAQYPYASGCTNNSTYCAQNPTAYGCPGYNGTTTGSSTGGSASCAPPVSGQQTVCANYCAYFPGSSGCLANGTNCNYTPTAAGCPGSSTVNGNNYGALYPQGVPAGSCSAVYAPSSNPSAYDTRKGTMTVVGGSWYNPESGSGSYLNTSSLLTSVSTAKTFFMTDSVLKVRFKIRPQPDSAMQAGVCYGRNTGASIPGYTKLKFTISVKGYDANNVLSGVNFVKMVDATGVNSCTDAIDLSPYKAQYPNGMFVIVSDVTSNQKCSNYNYTTGFANCNVMGPVRTIDCWSLDMEVAADATKTFD
jgi:hypothetical protein